MTPEEEATKKKEISLLIAIHGLHKAGQETCGLLEIYWQLKVDGTPMRAQELIDACSFCLQNGKIENGGEEDSPRYAITRNGMKYIGLAD